MPTNEAKKVDSWDEEVTDVAPKQVDSWDEEVVDEPVKKKVTPSPSQTQSSSNGLNLLSGVIPSGKALLTGQKGESVQIDQKPIDLTNAPIAEDESTRTDKFIRKPIDKKKVDEIYNLSKQNESLIDEFAKSHFVLDNLSQSEAIKQLNDLYAKREQAKDPQTAQAIDTQIEVIKSQPVEKQPSIQESVLQNAQKYGSQPQDFNRPEIPMNPLTPNQILERNGMKTANTVGELHDRYIESANKLNELRPKLDKTATELDAFKKETRTADFKTDKSGNKTLEGLADIPEAFGHGFGGTMKSIEQGFVNLLGDKQDRIDYAKKRYLEDNILYPTRTKGMATSGAEMVGGVAPYVISTAVLPETALLGHVITNGLTMGASGYGNGYYEMFAKQKQQGASDEEADAVAMQNAKFEGAKETAIGASLPFMGGAGSKLFLAPAEKSAMKQFLATQGVIIPTFTAGKLASNVYQKYGLGEKDVNLGDGLAETAENGLILGAMMEFAHKAPAKLKELYRANLSEQYPSIQQAVDKAVQDGVMDASQAGAFTEKLKRDYAVFNAMPKDITTEQKLAIEPEVKQIIELSSREPSAVESPEVTKDKIVQLQKQVAEKLGTPLTEKEQKAYEKLLERQKPIKSESGKEITLELFPSEKAELNHYEKRIETAKENEAKLAEEKKVAEAEAPLTNVGVEEGSGVGGDVEIKNEGKADAPTKESVTERLSINNPFYKKVEDALVKLGLIEKYNAETGTGDVVGGYAQQTSDGGFSVGKMLFSQDGSISYFDGDVKVSFDKNGNVISENTKEAKQKAVSLEIESKKASIANFEKTRDSESFKYKEVTETDVLGNKKKVKRLKTEQELKESTDKINAAIDKAKAELSNLEQPLKETTKAESNVEEGSGGVGGDVGRKPIGDGKFVRYNPDDVLPLLPDYKPTNTGAVEDYVNQVVPNDASVEAYKTVPLDAIQTSEKIESKDRKAIDKIKEGIKNGDDIPPLVLDFSPVIKNGESYKFGLMDGHHRYIAYKELGIKEVPAAIVTSREHYTFETNDTNVKTLFGQSLKETTKAETPTTNTGVEEGSGVGGEVEVPKTLSELKLSDETTQTLENKLKELELERTNKLIENKGRGRFDDRLKDEIDEVKRKIYQRENELASRRNSDLESKIKDGSLLKLIAKNKITAEDARGLIIESGMEVPSEIQSIVDKNKQDKKENKQSIIERDTDFLGNEKEAYMVNNDKANGIRTQEDIEYFKSNVKRAIDNGKYQKAIADGKMTANDAKIIIESYGLKVPKDILEQSLKETTQSETKVAEKGVEEPKVEVAKTEVETPTENMQDVGVEEHIDGDVGNLSIDEKIKYISDKTGINLRKSKNTNSWYGNINGKDVRISDHPSKFVERGEQQGVPAIDLNLEYLHHDAIVHLLNDTNPFENYKKGDKITHSSDKIGEVTYLDSDYKKGYVEVETKDGRVVKYDANKFLGNEYKEQPKSETKVAEKGVEEPITEEIKTAIDNGEITREQVDGFTEQDESAIEDIERKAESEDETELNSAIDQADKLIGEAITRSKSKTEPSNEKVEGGEVKKTLVTKRAYEGSFREGVKKELEAIGLTRETENFEKAETEAKKFFDEYGEDVAIEAMKAKDIEGALGAFVWNEITKSVDKKLSEATDINEIEQLQKKQAELLDIWGKQQRGAGAFNAAMAKIYETSELGYSYEKQKEKWEGKFGEPIPKDIAEKFKQYDTELSDLKKRITEAEKKVKEAEEKQAFDNIVAEVRQKPKTERSGKRKIAEGLDELTNALGVKLSAVGDKKASATKALIKIGEGLIEEGIATAKNVAEKIREYVEDKFKGKIDIKEYEPDVLKYFEERLPKITERNGKIHIPDKLIKELVKNGAETIEDLVSQVKEIAKEDFPYITDREIRDSITKYGKTQNPTKDEILSKISRMKRIGRLISQLEDVQNKIRPLKSGLQRERMDAEERAMNKQLREELRNLPVDEETLAGQIRTVLDARKQGVQNRIEDLQREIEQGEKTPKNQRTIADDEALTKLKEQLEKVKAEHQEKFAEQNEAEKEAKRLSMAKKNTQKRIEDLTTRLREGNFSKVAKKEIKEDAELTKLRAEKIRIQEEFDKEFHKQELLNKKGVEKLKDRLWEIWSLPRALMATGEMSFVGVQGLINTIAHPIESAKAMKRAVEFAFSEKKTEQWLNEIKSQEYYPIMKKSKLSLTEPNAELTAREELFYSGWTNMIWDALGRPIKLKSDSAYEKWKELNPMRGVERASVGYLDTQRVSRFLDGMEMLKQKGITYEENPQAYKDVADVVNTFTGRASLGKLEMIAPTLSKVFFSPRNWASALKTATPYGLYHFGKMRAGADGFKPSTAQKMAISDLSKFVGVTTSMVMMAAATLNNDDDESTGVEFDPRSSDFMKIKIGDKRIDPWGGKIQQIIFSSRVLMDALHEVSPSLSEGGYKKKDEVMPLGVKYKSPTLASLSATQATNKLAPTMALLNKYASSEIGKDGKRKDAFGNEFKLSEEATKMLKPIYWGTVGELLKEDPSALNGLLAFYAFFGGGVNIYGKKKEKKKD